MDDLSSLAHRVALLPRLKLRGLMAIPAPVEDFAQQRKSFRRLREAFERLKESGLLLDTLSMGMSADLEAAVRGGALAGFATEVVVLVMEYRSIANRFLSPMEEHPGYADPGRISRSPLAEVDEMLVADKVQNFKDFRAHHQASHPRAARLERYFQRWLAALGVDPSEVDVLARRATLPAGVIGPPREV